MKYDVDKYEHSTAELFQATWHRYTTTLGGEWDLWRFDVHV